MSSFSKSLIAGIISVCIMNACSNKTNEPKVEFDKVSVSKEIALSKDDKNSPKCRISISVDYAKGNGKTEENINSAITNLLFNLDGLSVQQAVDSFANTYLRNYTESLRELYRSDKADSSRRSWYEYRYTVNTEVKSGRHGIVTYIASQTFFEGGTHDINQKLVMNFNPSTGKRLTLRDILVPGYESRLNEVLLAALEAKTGLKDINELHRDGYLYSMSIFAPDNFIIGKENITFIYNVYEIATYSKGMTELVINYSDINDLLQQ